MVQGPDGRLQPYIPFRLGYPGANMRHPSRSGPTPHPTPGISPRHTNGSSASVSSNVSAAPISTRNMPPPPVVPPSRTPSNGIMRPPVTPTVPAILQQGSPPHYSPTGPNGIAHDPSAANGEQDVKLSAPIPNIISMQSQPNDLAGQTDSQLQNMVMSSPVRPKSQTPTMIPIPNGFTIPTTANFNSHISNGTYAHHAGMRNQATKSAFAASLVPDGANPGQVQIRQQTYPIGAHPMTTSSYNAQIQAARLYQVQQNAQRPQMNIVDASGMDGGLTLSLSPPNGVPPRTPSANGTRSVAISRGLTSPALAQAMAVGQGRTSPGTPHIGRMTPHPPHSPPNLLSPGLSAAQPHGSPPRPQPPMPSPSLQARQVVGGSGVGY